MYGKRTISFLALLLLFSWAPSLSIAKEQPKLGSPVAAWFSDYKLTEEYSIYKIFDDRYRVVETENGLNYHIGIYLRYLRVKLKDAHLRDLRLSLKDARAFARAFFPDDAKFVKSYSPKGRPEAIVDLYSSKSIISVFDKMSWIRSKPGEFIALYKVFDGLVHLVLIGPGNNP